MNCPSIFPCPFLLQQYMCNKWHFLTAIFVLLLFFWCRSCNIYQNCSKVISSYNAIKFPKLHKWPMTTIPSSSWTLRVHSLKPSDFLSKTLSLNYLTREVLCWVSLDRQSSPQPGAYHPGADSLMGQTKTCKTFKMEKNPRHWDISISVMSSQRRRRSAEVWDG